MEFNADGSLKLGTPKKTIKTKAKLVVRKTSDGSELLIEILDPSVPYNLIEGTFHQLNDGYECDVHLGKKSETYFDITVTGKDADVWVKTFTKEIVDYLDGLVDVIDEK